jgi:hypothetical protein
MLSSRHVSTLLATVVLPLTACSDRVNPGMPELVPPVVEGPRVIPDPVVPGPAVRLLSASTGVPLAEVGTDTFASVRVVDAVNRGVPGVVVSFVVESGGGQLAAATAVTTGDGYAMSPTWRMGTVESRNIVRASVPGLGDVRIAFEAVEPVGTLDGRTYVLHGVDGLDLPGIRRLTQQPDTLLAGLLEFTGTGYRAWFMFTRGAQQLVETYEGTYSQDSARFRLEGRRIWGIASADGRLQLVSDDDAFGIMADISADFVAKR